MSRTRTAAANPVYVIFCGSQPVVHTQDLYKADNVCSRLNRLNALLCKKEWELMAPDCRLLAWDNDYENFLGYNQKYYRVETVPGLMSDLYGV